MPGTLPTRYAKVRTIMMYPSIKVEDTLGGVHRLSNGAGWHEFEITLQKRYKGDKYWMKGMEEMKGFLAANMGTIGEFTVFSPSDSYMTSTNPIAITNAFRVEATEANPISPGDTQFQMIASQGALARSAVRNVLLAGSPILLPGDTQVRRLTENFTLTDRTGPSLINKGLVKFFPAVRAPITTTQIIQHNNIPFTCFFPNDISFKADTSGLEMTSFLVREVVRRGAAG